MFYFFEKWEKKTFKDSKTKKNDQRSLTKTFATASCKGTGPFVTKLEFIILFLNDALEKIVSNFKL